MFSPFYTGGNGASERLSHLFEWQSRDLNSGQRLPEPGFFLHASVALPVDVVGLQTTAKGKKKKRSMRLTTSLVIIRFKKKKKDVHAHPRELYHFKRIIRKGGGKKGCGEERL